MNETSLPNQIGARLRRFRVDNGRSLASVAQQLGISSSALSQIETGAMQPSVNRLVELVGVLGVPVSAIFDEVDVFAPDLSAHPREPSEPIPGVLVAEAAGEAPARLAQGVQYRRLSPIAIPGVDIFESLYPPGSSSSDDGAMLVHAGYESGHVVQGRLSFEFSEGVVRLSAGDSLSFSASRPHRVRNESDEVAVAIWLTVQEGPRR